MVLPQKYGPPSSQRNEQMLWLWLPSPAPSDPHRPSPPLRQPCKCETSIHFWWNSWDDVYKCVYVHYCVPIMLLDDIGFISSKHLLGCLTIATYLIIAVLLHDFGVKYVQTHFACGCLSVGEHVYLKATTKKLLRFLIRTAKPLISGCSWPNGSPFCWSSTTLVA